VADTIKITCGSPELTEKLKHDIIMLLYEYEKTLPNAGQRIAARHALSKVRVVPGER